MVDNLLVRSWLPIIEFVEYALPLLETVSALPLLALDNVLPRLPEEYVPPDTILPRCVRRPELDKALLRR